MMTSDTQQGAVIGAFAVKHLGFKRIAIVDDRSAYGQGLADQFEKAAKAAGAKIIGREYSSDKAVDFKGVLTKLKRANPQAIFYGGADAQAAPMVKQMQALDIKAVLMAGEMVKSETFLKLAGKAAEGTVASLAGQSLDEMPADAKRANRMPCAEGNRLLWPSDGAQHRPNREDERDAVFGCIFPFMHSADDQDDDTRKPDR
ncbi:hypothetical protein CPC16_001687 [Podila verticillata]|nr:hypothetical protein CPC16_001687 [Podila verticillata]